MRYPRLSLLIIALVIVGFIVVPAIAIKVATPVKTTAPAKTPTYGKTIAPLNTTQVKEIQYISFSPLDKSFSAKVPGNWTYEADSVDIFNLYTFTDPVTSSWFTIVKATPPGTDSTLNQFKEFRLANPPGDLTNLKVVSINNTKFLNTPAYLITMTGNFEGNPRKVLEILTVNKGKFYDIFFNSKAEQAVSDKKIFDSVVNSLKI